MIDISNIQVTGWQAAIRGMRNSRQSWDNSDSEWNVDGHKLIFKLGPNDLALAHKLAKSGGSHAKFRRMINVSMDILAPLYWWKEFDTYKIGTVANSTSTMYSIMNNPFSVDQFSIHNPTSGTAGAHLINTVDTLNELREQYLNESNSGMKRMYWYDVISLLPSSYNQLRTVSMNYEVASHIVYERLFHRLDEWQSFCLQILNNLPYADQLIFNVLWQQKQQ